MSEILTVHGDAIVETCQIISLVGGLIIFIACIWALKTIEIEE